MWEKNFERYLAFVVSIVGLLASFVPGINVWLALVASVSAPVVFLTLSSRVQGDDLLSGLFQILRYVFVAWVIVISLQQVAKGEFPQRLKKMVPEEINHLHYVQTHGNPDIDMEEVARAPNFLKESTYIVHAWTRTTAQAVPLDTFVRDTLRRKSEPMEDLFGYIGLIMLILAAMLRAVGRAMDLARRLLPNNTTPLV
jgi:hypothetical protein